MNKIGKKICEDHAKDLGLALEPSEEHVALAAERASLRAQKEAEALAALEAQHSAVAGEDLAAREKREAALAAAWEAAQKELREAGEAEELAAVEAESKAFEGLEEKSEWSQAGGGDQLIAHIICDVKGRSSCCTCKCTYNIYIYHIYIYVPSIHTASLDLWLGDVEPRFDASLVCASAGTGCKVLELKSLEELRGKVLQEPEAEHTEEGEEVVHEEPVFADGAPLRDLLRDVDMKMT